VGGKNSPDTIAKRRGHASATLSPTFHRSSRSHTTVLTSTVDPVFIFKDGKLKPGIYKIQNIVDQTYRVEVGGLRL